MKSKVGVHIFSIIIVILALAAFGATLYFSKKRLSTFSGLRVPILVDKDGILLMQLTIDGTSIDCCFDTASLNLLVADGSCEGCFSRSDADSTYLDNKKFKCDQSEETITYGTQQDIVHFCSANRIQIHGLTHSLDIQNLRFAISKKRTGSSSYNILGMGKGARSFIHQAGIKDFILNIKDNYVDINPRILNREKFHMLSND